MMKNKTVACMLLSLLMLSACSSPATNSSAPAASSEQSTESGSSPAATGTETSGTNTPAADDKATGNETTAVDSTGTTDSSATGQTGNGGENTAATTDNAQVAYTYHMNKSYNIVPNEESAATPKKVVLLTFDDGPKDKNMINSMMDTLDKHHAKAIFFVNGYRIKSHPELLKLIHDRGGVIGNHTYDHIVLKKESKAKVTQQIEDTQTLIKQTIDVSPRFLRAPNGATNDTVHELAKKHNMLYMNWSVGSLDWVNQKDPDAVITNVMDQLHSGSIILMHELPWTVEALDRLLTKLEQKGYSFVDPNAIDNKVQ
ncbi:polysaccharide deacetylase family protein [Paenibacillus sp. SGZ-1009]|uniref:polysaccharide deacetylase family protein n=1 Tax=Paenibacillus campi TaxID=3106031 RepID=UPI002AFDD603|nr:polysaccharide deacetylase family protein [Paenibacillus sp. SGZ-1009]